jgi:16S rRNA (cytidine1402-2'-O)-methyltransferase
MMKGNLYLIPTVLNGSRPSDVLPETVFRVLDRLNYYIAENIRTARRFIKSAGSSVPIDDITFFELNKHTSDDDLINYLVPAKTGSDMGLLSEAGVPCVADPGSKIVAIAHESGLRVIPLTGPSSVILALMASGLNGQNFVFHGYLPVNKAEKINTLKKIERESGNRNQAQIFMETPFRNLQMVDAITTACNLSTMLCIACDLTLDTEMILTRSISWWKKNKPDIDKRPAIFILQDTG